MSYHGFGKIISFAGGLLFSLFVMQGESVAGTRANQIQEKVIQTIEVQRQTQKYEDAWAKKKAELLAHYRSLKANKGHLERLKLETERALDSQKTRVAELERKIKESARIREELQSYLESVVAQLEEFIKRDLPFLLKERTNRITSIKDTLVNPDISPAEKYRRVMEAVQVETEYGRTVEVYQDSIELDGKGVLVDVLRLGRLSLFCQTPDGKVVGHYDRVSGKWAPLPSRYRREINRAVEMARRERTIDLVKLPIGRIIVP